MATHIDLGGTWRMRPDGGAWIPAGVPGTVYGALLEACIAPDPYDQDNEKLAEPFLCQDYTFERDFVVDAALLARDRVFICCDGLDTLAVITLNGKVVGETNNMHRRYRFNVKEHLCAGENTLSVRFASSLAFVREHAAQGTSGKGVELIRKAQCMFGWDWGLSLPDMGIWRGIRLEAMDAARLNDVSIWQQHAEGRVDLAIRAEVDVYTDEPLSVRVTLTAPDGSVVATHTATLTDGAAETAFAVENPALWWPNGQGAQPLYTVETELLSEDNRLNRRSTRIGLRTVALLREKPDGSPDYRIEVNSQPLFIKGANLIIEDALLSRRSPARTRRMLEDAAACHFNCVRVWGGAHYPDEGFYDLCDELGLLVYQDFMFACKFYPATDAFVENVAREAEDNLRLLRNHACVAVLCGNNEGELLYTALTSDDPANAPLRALFGGRAVGPEAKAHLWAAYSRLFSDVLPKISARIMPDTPYVQSTPSIPASGEARSLFDFFARGDVHYYLAYDGRAPYEKMRGMHPLFVTEMGFQSYPSMKTIRAFARPEDESPYSPVMYAHQKCKNGNEDIEHYMRLDYGVPESFADYVYASQLQAGEILRDAVEHLRRDGCRGVLLWQMNDCWPVVSWSGVDYYGRWKAQQHYARRFFAPVLASACEVGGELQLWVSNDSTLSISGQIEWKLLAASGEVLTQGNAAVDVIARSSVRVASVPIAPELNRRKIYLAYTLIVGSEAVSQGTHLLCKAKDFALWPAAIRISVTETEDCFTVTLDTDHFAKGVMLELRNDDCAFSDNFIDLLPSEPQTIYVAKNTLSRPLSLEDFTAQLTALCLNDVYARRQME